MNKKSVLKPIVIACLLGFAVGAGSAVFEKVGMPNSNKNGKHNNTSRKAYEAIKALQKAFLLNDKKQLRTAYDDPETREFIDLIKDDPDVGKEVKEKIDKLIAENEPTPPKPTNGDSDAKQHVDRGDDYYSKARAIVQRGDASKGGEAVDLYKKAMEEYQKAIDIYSRKGGVPKWLDAKLRDAIADRQICKKWAY